MLTEKISGKSIVTIIVRLVIIYLIGYIFLTLNPSWRGRVATAFDYFDSRPSYRILFIGNSRTYYNDMPYMIRDIADSAGAKYKVQATMHALSARSLKDHWENTTVHDLLEQNWDHVVIQARSGAHGTEQDRLDFFEYGEQLSGKAKRHSGKVSLFVGWPYSSKIFKGDVQAADLYDEYIQEDHQKLSESADVDNVNIGAAWGRQLSKNDKLRLEIDGNHPNMQGSYLAALAIYKTLPEADLFKVSYVPGDISPEQAEQIILSVNDAG